jgi:poly(3-hydroxybutyrate) depolymerase
VNSKAAAVIAVLFLTAFRISAAVVEKTGTFSGMTVHYKIVLPEPYDPAKAYPGILAFSGGSQALNTVDMDLRRNWRAEAEKRGYIVAIPVAPDGRLFFEDGARIFPEFIRTILAGYKILDDKFHVAGPSNGGISAFHMAASYPQYFWSITGYPGYLQDATPARVRALSKMCVFMFAGELDADWSGEMKTQSQQFRAQGLSVRTSVEKGQPHLIDTLAGDGAARLFDQFEQARKGCN